MSKHTFKYATCLALPFAAVVCAGPVLAQTVEGAGSSKVMMFDRPPSVDELREVVAPSEPKVRTRSIEIVGGAANSAAQRPRPTDQVNYGPAPTVPPAPEASRPTPAAVQKAPPRQPPRSQAAQPAPQQAAVSEPAAESEKPQAFGFRINFAFNSAEIPREYYSYIDAVGGLMSQDLQLTLLVEGHTDAVGSLGYNQTLSERRAISVGEYLVRIHHIDPQRIAVAGKGPSEPIASDPYDGRNRRVEFKPAR